GFVVNFTGRINQEKGIVELVDAICLLRNKGLDIFLLLVGPIDERSGLDETFLQKLKEKKFIARIGYTRTPELYFGVSDILCLPSYREGFGGVVIEAALMGIPAVGSNIHGLQDAIIHNVTGTLVPVGNVGKLADAIERHVHERADLRAMGRQAQARALIHFTQKFVTGLIEAEYQKRVAAKR
ncbi:MAG: glycosyltransferase, partial [Proteobacteria bacterium]